MNVLVDTNLLARFANPNDPNHAVAVAAIRILRHRGDVSSLVRQVLTEFWVVATRPITENGLESLNKSFLYE